MKFISLRQCILVGLLGICYTHSISQVFPSQRENFSAFITFGHDASSRHGDDDNSQEYYFTIPKSFEGTAYIRVYDPDCGGSFDQIEGSVDSKFSFEIYGGAGVVSDPMARNLNPVMKMESGTKLFSKTFGSNETYDEKWYTLSAITPQQGEFIPPLDFYVFKIVVKGQSGNDGNAYRFFLSTYPDANSEVPKGNGFAYEYSFRLPDSQATCHVYPYIGVDVTQIKQNNFDWDHDGLIQVHSVRRKGENFRISNDGAWASSQHDIYPEENRTFFDIQFQKMKNTVNNNVVFSLANQQGEAIPLVARPRFKNGQDGVKNGQ